jgi:hypothetical protein
MAAILPLLGLCGMDVLGPSACPAPHEIAAELGRLSAATSPRHGEGEERLSAEVRRDQAGLSITLRNEAGAVLAERVITGGGSCADLAAAAAVVIAAWQGTLRPDLGPTLPDTDVAPARRRAPAARVPAVASAHATGPGGPSPMDLGVAALVTAAGNLSPGIQIDGALGRVGSPLAFRLAASVHEAHTLGLEPPPDGRTLWSRSTLGAGVRHRTWWRSLALDGHLDLRAALVRAEGAGFDENHTRYGFDMGAGAGVRLAWARTWVAPFVELGGSLWSGRKLVVASGTEAESIIPRWAGLLALGVSVGRFR